MLPSVLILNRKYFERFYYIVFCGGCQYPLPDPAKQTIKNYMLSIYYCMVIFLLV